MIGPSCCRAAESAENESRERPARRRASRWLDAVGWLVPATALALMPKCPMCVAAYLAIFTGIGVALPVATAMRTTLLVLGIAALTFMTVRTLARSMQRE